MRYAKHTVSALALLGLLTTGCGKNDPEGVVMTLPTPQLPEPMASYTLPVLPAHFDSPALDAFESIPEDNPITDAGATLGRVLFYDRSLSASYTVSCGSCHHQEHGFADTKARSQGHSGGLTRRNASHIVNQFYLRRQFWDQRANTLEEQVLMPVQDPIEMGLTLEELTARVQRTAYYPPLFAAAFGDPGITTDRISKALSQFVRSIVSFRSRYDEGEANGFADLSQQELEGKALFFNTETRCNQCHMTANFFTPQSMNNALDLVYADNGVGERTGDPADDGKFKVPSLRNVAVTGPYMHDGRFLTLEEVVEHYNSGLKPHANIDDRLTSDNTIGGTPYQLQLTTSQKQALVAFLRTLTDEPLLSDPRFSDPFVP
jgi:cytochrome c peroxidase